MFARLLRVRGASRRQPRPRLGSRRIAVPVPGAALLADGYTGKANRVLDAARSIVVGATFVGQVTTELLHSATIAVTAQVPLDVLRHAVPSFPTVSEV